MFYVGVDIGGTHTDCVVMDDKGAIWANKAYTTHHNYSEGILTGLELVANGIGISLEDLLKQTRLFLNGTTVATNTIAQLSGCRVGLVTTLGFGDVTVIARGQRGGEIDFHKAMVPYPELLP